MDSGLCLNDGEIGPPGSDRAIKASVAARRWVEKRPGQMPGRASSFILSIAFIGDEAWASGADRRGFGGFSWR
jgi:hypothetical protein